MRRPTGVYSENHVGVTHLRMIPFEVSIEQVSHKPTMAEKHWNSLLYTTIIHVCWWKKDNTRNRRKNRDRIGGVLCASTPEYFFNAMLVCIYKQMQIASEHLRSAFPYLSNNCCPVSQTRLLDFQKNWPPIYKHSLKMTYLDACFAKSTVYPLLG